MSDASPILGLPFIQPSQAQKHVSHNEAIRLLDVMVQLAVADRDRTSAPTDPAPGDRHIVASGATGDWAGRDGQIAFREEGGWAFLPALPGFVAQVLDEDRAVVWSGSAWQSAADLPQSFPELGVNAAADATNRLAVGAAASLFTHAGSGGHQLKLNKATAGDTASLLFQTGFSGRAEMGTAGADDFAVKVSPDGSAWHDALIADRTTGRTRLPGGLRLPDGSAATPALGFHDDADTGLVRAAANTIGFATAGVQRLALSASAFQIDLPVTGTAVMTNEDDTTAGRLMDVGAFGLGGYARLPASEDFDLAAVSGFFRANSGGLNKPAGSNFSLLNMPHSANLHAQVAVCLNTGTGFANRMHLRTKSGAGTWHGWTPVITGHSVWGTVAQSGGINTGAVMESNASAAAPTNGYYRRTADGAQDCWFSFTSSAAGATSWTFPAAFLAASVPVVTGCAVSASTALSVVLDAAPSNTAATISVRDTTGARVAAAVCVCAIGRWSNMT